MSDWSAIAWVVVGAWLTSIGITVAPLLTVWIVVATVCVAMFIGAYNIGGLLGRVAGRWIATGGDDSG